MSTLPETTQAPAPPPVDHDDDTWLQDVPVPPSGDDLPCDDGEPMETELHGKQMRLTQEYAIHYFAGQRVYVAANMAFYYSALQAKNLDFKAPDIMILKDVDPHVRQRWVVWEEDGVRPSFVLELVSASTKRSDFGRKKNVYERLHVRDYFIYDPLTTELWGWQLVDDHYVALVPDEHGRLRAGSLGLSLGVATASWLGVEGPWLRFFTPDGAVVPTEGEAERSRADAVQQRAEAAERELAALKRQLGMG